MPQSEHEDVAAEPKSATRQYLKPLLERASVQPVKAQPSKKTRSSRAKSRDADEDSQLEAFEADTRDHDPGQDLIAAK
jgi:hypothetical protein